MPENNSIDSIINDIVDIIANKLKTNPSEISPHMSLSKLGIESLKVVEIIYDIEVQFNLGHMTADNFSKIKTIYDIAKMVESNSTRIEK